MIALTNIVVATDFGPSSDTALRYGRALARKFGAMLHVMHVVDDFVSRGMEAETPAFWYETQRAAEEEAAARLAARVPPDGVGREHAATVAAVDPAAAIVAYARDAAADLIVMGTHGAQPAAGSGLGSVAERVVHSAPCPVLTVKHPEHEFVKANPDASAVTHA